MSEERIGRYIGDRRSDYYLASKCGCLVGAPPAYPDLAAELVKLKVDIIVTGTNAGVQAAQRATRTIPIVMGFVSDPVALGLIANLARPGGNITGLGVPTPELAGKRLQRRQEIAPTVARIAVVSDPSQPRTDLRETEAAARALGVQLQVWDVDRRAFLTRRRDNRIPDRAVGRRAVGGQDRSNGPVDPDFPQALRDLGYVDGRNLPILPRESPSGSPLSRPNWLCSRLMSSWPQAQLPPWPPST